MRLRLTLLLLLCALALPAYATDTLTVQVDRDNGTTQITDKLVLTPANLGAREKLSASRTYYVATTGSDSNNGLAVGTPFLTLQHAIDVASNLDLGSYNATIQMADGTYDYSALNRVAVTRTTAATSWQHTASQGTIQGYIIIQGNATTPRNVDIIGTISASGGTSVIVKDLKLRQTSASATHLLFAQLFSYLGFSNVVFGSLARTDSMAAHLRTESGGFIGALGDYAIDAGTTSHIYANVGGMFWIQGKTITLNSTPSFTGAFVTLKSNGNIYIDNTYVGSATGRKYDVASGGALQGVASTLPGDAAGVAASGGGVEGTESYALATKIGTLTSAKWCTSDGTAINCTSDAPTGSTGANASGFYIVSQAANAPTNAVNLGALSSGLLKSTVSGGVSTLSVDGNTYLTSESDPKVGATTNGNICKGTGSQISCTDTNAYLTAESDPKVGSTTNGNFCKGTGSQVSCTDTNAYLTSSSAIANVHPAADSTTAVQITKANGTTSVVNVDTSNSRVGVNTTVPQAAFDLRQAGTGAAWISNTNAPASNAGAGLFVQSLGGMGVVTGNRLGFVTFGADLDGTHNSSGIGYGAAISAYATGTYAIPNGSCTAAGVPSACCSGVGSGTCTVNTPAELRFETATTGTTTRTVRMKVTDSGRILMGPTLPTDDGATALQVNGAVKTTGLTGITDTAVVANLHAANSDALNGHADTYFLAATAQAADSLKLNGHADTYFLAATAQSSDSDKLDGQHGSYYATAVQGAKADSAIQEGSTHSQGTSTTLDVGAKDGFQISAASGTVSLTMSNLANGKYFDIEVISTSGALTLNAPLFTGATFPNGNNSTTVSAGKSSHYVCKGTGSSTAKCYVLAESK